MTSAVTQIIDHNENGQQATFQRIQVVQMRFYVLSSVGSFNVKCWDQGFLCKYIHDVKFFEWETRDTHWVWI